MRTPSWESSAGALAAMFGEFGPMLWADAWTITLASGTVLRWTGGDTPLTFGGNTFTLGPGITRSRIKWRVGISTDTMTMMLTDIVGTTINGQPLPAFIRARGLDGAKVQLERVFWRPTDAGPVGALLWFVGDVDDADGDRYQATVTVASWTKRLEVAVPNGVYQTACLNQLFDGRCGLSRAAHTITGAATSATDSYRSSFSHAISAKPTGWATLGRITMTSGANAGVTRTCKLHGASTLQALQPWPFAVASGDTFSLEAGCDRLKGTCETKFANVIKFRGTPYVPAAETVL